MEYKKSIIILILTIFLFSIASVCASDANDTAIASEDTTAIELSQNEEITTTDETQKTIQTNDTEMLTANDEETTATQNNLDTLSLEEKIYTDLSNAVGTGGDINLQPAYYKYNGESNTITITNPGIINGNGAIIDMNGSTIMAFYISASGVTIKNLTLKNANYNGNGGAIYFSNSATSGTVTNCNFTDNTAYRGGAVYFSSNGEVTNCNFTGNTATYDGGAVYFNGKGDVSNCNFTGNIASDDGGAVYFDNSGTVTNCNFTNNTATQNGGAVYFHSTGNVTNCNFTGNNATGDGGAIYFLDQGTVTNCNFTGNTAEYGGSVYFNGTGEVTNCNFTKNSASSRGGAVYFYQGTGSVTNCNFTDNSAINGGAVWMNSGTVSNCNFVDNKATGDYSYGGAIRMNSGTVSNCNFTGNKAYYGGAIYIYSGTVTNCNFTGNTATGDGGAVCFEDSGDVTNCNFINNKATGTDSWGGAIFILLSCTVTNCNFVDNKVTGDYSYGGAIYSYSGTVTNCNFTNNTATYEGGAVYFTSNGEVTNCNFTDNQASSGGAIFSQNSYTAADTCIFKRNSGDNVNVVIYPPTLNVDNFTTVYGSCEKLTFDLKTNRGMPVYNGNISISVYFKNDNGWVGNYSCLSGEGWTVNLPVGSYITFFDTEYAKFQKINRTVTITMPNVRYSINVSSVTTNNKTVNITAKTDIPKNILWDGKLLFILPNGTNITANYAGNGAWWALHTFDDYAAYNVTASYIGLDNVSLSNATITISKAETELTAKAITATYNSNKKLIITLKDVNGKPLGGVKVTVKIRSDKTYITDAKGQVKISVGKLTPKTYNVKIAFKENADFRASQATVRVTVKKAKSKITAKKKTVKKAKYVVTLKSGKNSIKKVKVLLKIKKKTFKAKTDKKGKATFKIKKLKKGKYTAKITFKGNKYYKKSTKNVRLRVR